MKSVCEELIRIRDSYRDLGVSLRIAGLGTTGYGEMLSARAFNADYHVVETVAHAAATMRYVPDVSFILDIGGQDMKALFLNDGAVTDVIINEACSSGCGSFIENFASSLGIPAEQIANSAFSSERPASLGSRCTVFMNSSIVTAQRCGATGNDIMAGLCRSVIQNVFTKVIRENNLDRLGDRIVVQGGTFLNDAVLRALEEYLGREVIRAPYPELMGAIGAALMAQRHSEPTGPQTNRVSDFIGLEALDDFSYTQEHGMTCGRCNNHCRLTVTRFSDGRSWVSGNRCERGGVLDTTTTGTVPPAAVVSAAPDLATEARAGVVDLFSLRQKLLLKEYPCKTVSKARKEVIGIPLVLEFWNSLPFWTTFFKALGFSCVLSKPSTRKLYENGLSAVPSDTVCLPAKLVHGHIRDLVSQGVDRIFMPSITTMPRENASEDSVYVCAIVKGYPMVVRNADNPRRNWHIPFDNPLFHWYCTKDRNHQLCAWMAETFKASEVAVMGAIEQADAAQDSFSRELQNAGRRVLDGIESNRFAVVLAARPYHNDPFVNHSLPEHFTRLGISVLTVDSLPGIFDVDLSRSRLDIVNNYHARMLSAAIISAEDPRLEYVQIVSFGCGHDALLSDEIARLMKEVSGKSPLVLKLDESDAAGPLHIRVASFVETLRMPRRLGRRQQPRALRDPYPVKYGRRDQHEKTILVPNVSQAFARVMSAALRRQKVRAEALPLGGRQAIELGKRYIHNDICFPAQITIGEALAALKSGKYDPDTVAIGTGKLLGDCRLTHYAALLRKALDDAGYAQVPIITNDGAHDKGMHPGFRMGLLTQLRILLALPMIDVLEELLRKIRPYENIPGQTQRTFEQALAVLTHGIERGGFQGCIKAFKTAIDLMQGISYDRSRPRSKVFVIGEYLLNFHPGSNGNIERYLEENGMEVVLPNMADVYQKSYFCQHAQIKEYGVRRSPVESVWASAADTLFDLAHRLTESIAARHPLHKPVPTLRELTKKCDPIIHHTFDSGEGFLIAAELLRHASEHIRSFVILQPFGCLPNHICGRGVTRRIKELFQDIQILPLDFDPDISFANIENRLQMLIMRLSGLSRGRKT